MFIVVEGPDGSGKSSVVSALIERATSMFSDREVVTYHMGRPAEETRAWVLNEWATSVANVNWTDGYIVIADRWHWGEVTYAPIKRPHTCTDEYGLLGKGGWRLVELMLLSRGAVQFVMKQPLDVIVERVGVRGDDFVKTSELEKICELYDFGMRNAARVEVVSPDPYDMSALPALADRMLTIAKEREAQVKNVAQFPEYIGPARPSVLLVGDRRNDPNGPILPFFPARGNSGDYLLTHLPDPFWKNVGIVNGTELCGSRMSLLWATIGRPRIVALGRMAEKSLKDASIPRELVNVVPHPQYVRRFHHRDGYEYGRAIERLSTTHMEVDPWTLR